MLKKDDARKGREDRHLAKVTDICVARAETYEKTL